MQCRRVKTNRFQRIAERRALNHFFDNIAVLADVNVRFVRHTEKIVVVAHHFLIRADQHHRQIIRFAFDEFVQRQNFFDIVQINEFVNDAVRIAGDVAKRRVFGRLFIQFVNRDNWEKLLQRPIVRHRAKHRKVRQVFGAQ